MPSFGQTIATAPMDYRLLSQFTLAAMHVQGASSMFKNLVGSFAVLAPGSLLKPIKSLLKKKAFLAKGCRDAAKSSLSSLRLA